MAAPGKNKNHGEAPANYGIIPDPHVKLIPSKKGQLLLN